MFTLTLVTPEKRIVSGQEIEEVFVPAHLGELNILPGHAPLMTTLSTGVLKYRLKGQDKFNYAAISWGYCQVNPHGVNVLAETAERPEELDVARIDKALKKAEEAILSGEFETDYLQKYFNKIRRAQTRKDVLEQSGGNA